MTRPCMGGWCRLRERCAHYEADSPHPLAVPAERLCAPGERDAFESVISPKPQTWVSVVHRIAEGVEI